MKHLLLVSMGFLIFNSAAAQADSSACLAFRKGYFSYTDSLGHTVLVDRGKNYQYEKNTVTRVKTQLRIQWTGSCSYQIIQTGTNSKAARKYKYSSTTVHIDKADGANGYSYSCGCSTPSKTTSGYMKKLSRQQYYRLF